MSSIQQFSMSALADLMIVEEPEEYCMDDDENHNDDNANTTDRSADSAQNYSDYETEDFEQESVCKSPQTQRDDYDDFENDEDANLINNLESQSRSIIPEPDASALTGCTSSSGGALSYSDSRSQNENSSRTMHAMPMNKFSMSPILPACRTSPRGDSRSDHDNSPSRIGEVTDLFDPLYKRDDNREDSFEHGHSHHMLLPSSHLKLSSPGGTAGGSSALHIGRDTHSAATNYRNVRSKVAYGRQSKGFSAVKMLSAEEVRRARTAPPPRLTPALHVGAQQLQGHEDHNLNAGDITLMREVRRVLNKIEQCDAVSQQVHQAMSRRSVVVQGLRLGSGGPSFCTQQRSSRGPSSNTRRNNWNSSGGEGLREYSQSRGVAGGVAVPADSQSCDDARVFRETSFYDEDDTRDVLASSLALTSLSSLPEAPPESDLMSVDVAEQEKEHEHRHQQMNETKQYEERKKKDVAVLEPASSRAGLVGKVVRTGLPGGELPRRANETACVDGRRRRGEPSLSAERRASLASLAEDTYATFLADIIDIAKARASSSSSADEFAMHRSLSEFLFRTFSKPDTVDTVCNNMIDAAAVALMGD